MQFILYLLKCWVFQSKVLFVCWKIVLEKLFSKLSCVCLLLEKLVNRKHFPVKEKYFSVKEKFGLVFRQVFSFYFAWKTLFESCEKFRNIILFADYIKFGPQTFDCYIYFVFNIFFQFHHLEFNFYINFGPYFYNFYLLFPYHFLIEIFYLSNLIIILLIVTYFIWNNLWNVNYYYFNFFIFYFLDLISIIFLLFILFEIIYEIIFFFNFILIQLFYL